MGYDKFFTNYLAVVLLPAYYRILTKKRFRNFTKPFFQNNNDLVRP